MSREVELTTLIHRQREHYSRAMELTATMLEAKDLHEMAAMVRGIAHTYGLADLPPIPLPPTKQAPAPEVPWKATVENLKQWILEELARGPVPWRFSHELRHLCPWPASSHMWVIVWRDLLRDQEIDREGTHTTVRYRLSLRRKS